MASQLPLLSAYQHRRSNYALTSSSPIPDSRIKEIVATVMQTVPSAFDSQSTRLVVLLNDEHRKFWDIALEVLGPQLTSPEQRKSTEGRLGGFRKAKGTILFFEDPAPLKQYQSKFPLYASKFPQWSYETNGMHQYALWTALAAEGLGVNLQHYDPLVDNRAKAQWGIDLEWSLRAEMVFGGLEEGAKPRDKDVQGREKGAVFHGAE